MATSATTSRVAALMGHDELRAPVWLSSARTAPQSEDELVQLELSAAELHRGWLLRCLSFTANRIVAALNEVDLFYATVPQQRVTQRQLAKRQPVRTHMGHALWAWSKVLMLLGLLRLREGARPMYQWVLWLDNDATFSTRALHPWLRGTPGGAIRRHPREVRLPLRDLADNKQGRAYHQPDVVAEDDVCAVLGKDMGGWRGVNAGAMAARNTRASHALLDEWWDVPAREGAPSMLTDFPAEQGALNTLLKRGPLNDTFERCVHVRPSADLYTPGHFISHFTGPHPAARAQTAGPVRRYASSPPEDRLRCFFRHYGEQQVASLFRLPNAAPCGELSQEVRGLRVEYQKFCPDPELGSGSHWLK